MSFVENLFRDYGDFKVEIPKWEILDEGVTVLWGPSGSGKTTVFRILLGLEPCPAMKWNFQGENLAKLKTPDRRLGVVFQTLELFPHMSAEENILFAGLENERELFCSTWNLDIQRLEVKNFYELAAEIAGCKFFLGNQSFCYQLAEAMKVPRILEIFPMMPNVIPVGSDGYDFYHQGSLDYYFHKLNGGITSPNTQNK